jgi:enoyl-CoA hydratase/carnithine racemase
VHGAGRSFSAGFDLKESAQVTRKGEADWRPVFEADLEVIMRFWHSPLPTVSAVHGACMAGACELALACDITVAAEDARFGEPELKFGAGVVALLLPWLTGPKQAKELLLTGNDRLTAAEALRIGLINRVVPEGGHLEAALQIARTMAVMDRDALRMTKQAINRSYEIMGLAEALAAGLESGVGIACLDTPERRSFDEIARKDGLKAALAWRESRFV